MRTSSNSQSVRAARPARGYPARMSDGTVGIAGDLAPHGRLRAAINLGNPVLAQGTAAAPRGVTIDIGRETAARLGIGVEFVCFDAARDSFAALVTGRADICFLGIEPARADEVAFTAAGDDRVPARAGRGTQGQRLHRRLTPPLRPDRLRRAARLAR